MARPKRSVDSDIRLLQALADPVRLDIVRQLAGEGTVCACNFTSCSQVAQPTVSHHLRVLREAGWVTTERRGTWIYYSLSPQAAERLLALAGQIATPAAPVPPIAPQPAGSLAHRARQLPVIQQ